jgi:hypothetical protein
MACCCRPFPICRAPTRGRPLPAWTSFSPSWRTSRKRWNGAASRKPIPTGRWPPTRSWNRRTRSRPGCERGARAVESLSKQAFADVAHASSIDPEWRHTAFVEALLCSRFYIGEDAVRQQLTQRSLCPRLAPRGQPLQEPDRREVLSWAGPAKSGALPQTDRGTDGGKERFLRFWLCLERFPSDEELADEALAARQPGSQDRFLWQWLLGDEELFANVERLNLAEYRAFWIRMLDTKVHLRNWRADLAELQRSRPEMKDWSVQLLQSDPPISLSNAISRRQERFDSPASGA